MNASADDFVPSGDNRRQCALDIVTDSNTPSVPRSSTPATSLFGPSIWSPITPAEATQSAGLPPKTIWEIYTNNSTIQKPLVGLGLSIDQGQGAIAGSARDQNNKSNVNSQSPTVQESALLTANTHPLIQYPFGTGRETANQPRVLPIRLQQDESNMQSKNQTSKPSYSAVAANINSGAAETFESTQQLRKAQNKINSPPSDTASEASILSPHYLIQHPELRTAVAPVFKQEHHPRGFKRLGKMNEEVVEAFPGAYTTASDANPEFYQMPFGTRVINIKTDVVENIYFSVRTSMWSTIEKVSRRIMEVWYSRKNNAEKVLFLFAVNGTKQFCGLAEMSGPWDPSAKIDGWKDSTTGAGCVGSIPIVWKYIKNVRYEDFADIVQDRNGQPVVNMWNGMHFDSDAGRKVVEIYVKTPHFTNVMVWAKSEYEQSFGIRRAPGASRIHGSNNHAGGAQSVRALRGGHGGQHGGLATRRNVPALTVDNWREPQPGPQDPSIGQVLNVDRDEGNQPTAAAPGPGSTTLSTEAPLPHFDGSGSEVGTTPRPGQVVSCVIDEHGNYIPIQNVTLSPIHQQLRNHGSQMRNNESRRGNGTGRGASRGRGHGGRGGIRIVKSFHNPPYSRAAQQQDDPFISGDQRTLQHSASAAAFSPQRAYNQAPTATPTPALHHAVSTASFASQAPPRFTMYQADSTPDVVSSVQNVNQQRKDNDSYPSWFRSADSLAGYHPKQLKHEVAMLKIEDTPSDLPGNAHTPTQQKVQDWAAKISTLNDFYPTPVDAGSVPIHKKPIYYRLLADKAEMKNGLAALKAGDEVGYMNLMANVSEIEAKLWDLTTVDDSGATVYSTRTRERGSSIADEETTRTGSSTANFNVSPERASDGRVLKSVSQAGHSPGAKVTRRGMRSLNNPYMLAMEREYEKDILRIVSSPTSSVQNNAPGSPKPNTNDNNVTTSSVGENSEAAAAGNGHGGVRLND